MNQIARYNDLVRKSLVGADERKTLQEVGVRHEVLMTAGIKHYVKNIVGLTQAIAGFHHFNEENDPYEEHDFFRFMFEDIWIIVKFSYYALDMEHGSEDPADLTKTVRVMMIMKSDEY